MTTHPTDDDLDSLFAPGALEDLAQDSSFMERTCAHAKERKDAESWIHADAIMHLSGQPEASAFELALRQRLDRGEITGDEYLAALVKKARTLDSKVSQGKLTPEQAVELLRSASRTERE